jgi:hypothetical protein
MNKARLFYVLLCFGVLFPPSLSFAQTQASVVKSVALDLSIGDSEGTLALMLNGDKYLGRQRKMVVGVGARFTSYLGKNQYYVTAPAKLTSGSTGPGVLFKENIEANMDSFLVKTAQVNSLNLALTIGYNFSEKLMLRFNIDALGFSFGKRITGNYINGSEGAMERANPTTFNLLLISDNDKGSLNSELFARYLLSDQWGIKGGIQFLFTEYTTGSEVQQVPEGNDRFRNKSLMFSAGVFLKL